ncbi:MAG TPA: diguanylate cyclase [Steroidobacteraceae bacterium]|nr:diguanylate cyclase [Steroidobacteraceae bacterium]
MNSESNSNISWTPTRPAAARILLWFDLLALVIGIAQLAVGGNNFASPLTVVALTWLVLSAIAVRALPSVTRRVWLRCALDTLALLVFATGLAASTGGTRSPLLTLLLLPLTASAIALGRAAYGLTAISVVVAVCVLGVISGEAIGSSAFIVWLISALAPAIIATTAIAVLMEQMQGAEQHIQDLSSTDTLTGFLNRRAFDEVLERTHRKAERSNHPYSIIAVDVAGVGQLNNAVNRDAGNQMIVAVGKAIGRSIRVTDVAARYEGDEFIVLLPDADATHAGGIAQRIRSNVYAGTVSVGNRLVRANVHLGLATYPKDRRDARELMQLAAQRMEHDRELHKTANTA